MPLGLGKLMDIAVRATSIPLFKVIAGYLGAMCYRGVSYDCGSCQQLPQQPTCVLVSSAPWKQQCFPWEELHIQLA